MATISDVKAGINLIDFVESDLGAPKKRAKNGPSFWPCPFHPDGRTPSLAVYPDHWHCYGCGESGDVLTWIMKRDNLSFKEACMQLSGGAVVNTRQALNLIPRVPVVKTPPGQAWQAAAQAFAVECDAALWDSGGDAAKAVRAYLAGRGLRPETCRAELVGYNEHDRRVPGDAWGVDGEVYLPSGITLPIYAGKNLWAVKVRQRRGREPKYIHVKGSVPGLYLAEDIKAGPLVVCEGEFDALLLRQQAGDLVSACTFGGATTFDYDTWLPYLAAGQPWLIATDNDEAGEKAWVRWQTTGSRARRLAPPAGVKDITDAFTAGHDLRKWVEAAL